MLEEALAPYRAGTPHAKPALMIQHVDDGVHVNADAGKSAARFLGATKLA